MDKKELGKNKQVTVRENSKGIIIHHTNGLTISLNEQEKNDLLQWLLNRSIEKVLIPEDFRHKFSENEEIEIELFDIETTGTGSQIATIINYYDDNEKNEKYVVMKNDPDYPECQKFKDRWIILY